MDRRSRFPQVLANGSGLVRFYRYDLQQSADSLITTVNIPNTGTGIDWTVASPPLLADTSLFRDGERCFWFYALGIVDFRESYETPPTYVCLQYQSATDAKTVNRVLPTFRATVTAVAPGTEAPTGTVDFYAGGNLICSGAVNNAGQASCSTLHHLIDLCPNYTAKYSGDAAYGASEDQGSFFP